MWWRDLGFILLLGEFEWRFRSEVSCLGEPKSHFAQHVHNLSYGSKRGWWVVWIAIVWSIWLQRNDAIFNSVLVCAEKTLDLIKFRSWKWLNCKKNDFILVHIRRHLVFVSLFCFFFFCPKICTELQFLHGFFSQRTYCTGHHFSAPGLYGLSKHLNGMDGFRQFFQYSLERY